jgi:hypothetical protein
MEVTKWPKPSECGLRIGDRASVQAVMRVNAEQASKRTMCRPTRQPFRGRLTRLDTRAKTTSRRCTGVVAAACTQGKRTQHGKPHGVIRDDQPDTREGSAARHGVAKRFVVPLSPVNAGGGKGPQFKTDAASNEGPGDWATYQRRTVFRHCRWRYTQKRRQKPVGIPSSLSSSVVSGGHAGHGDIASFNACFAGTAVTICSVRVGNANATPSSLTRSMVWKSITSRS